MIQLGYEARMRELATPGSAAVDVVRPARPFEAMSRLEAVALDACFSLAGLVDACRDLDGMYTTDPIYAETLEWVVPMLARTRELLWEVRAGFPYLKTVRPTSEAIA